MKMLVVVAALTGFLVFEAVAPVAQATNRAWPGNGWTNPVADPNYEDWGFGSCNPPYNAGKAHLGSDSQGSAPAGAAVKAMAAGTVVKITASGWPGAAIGIAHSGSGGQFVAVYGHTVSSVSVGATVTAGQTIGSLYDWTAGDGGANNEHLHLGIWPVPAGQNASAVALWGADTCVNGSVNTRGYVDPIPYLAGNSAAGTPTPTIGEGSFINATDNGEVYRVVGGAPIYVSSWNVYGGAQPTTAQSRAQVNAMRQYPADGTLIDAGGHVYRFAGGAPIYVSSWAAIGGSQSTIKVDPAALDQAGNSSSPWSHIRRYPADGTFVSGAGTVYRIAGGAPLAVSTWNVFGGVQPTTVIDSAAIDNADGAGRFRYLRQKPADGTFVYRKEGPVYRVAGGAPLYVSAWAAVGGQQDAVLVDGKAIDNSGTQSGVWSHLLLYPADGTVLRAGPSGTYYRVNGGVASPSSAATPNTIVDSAAINNAGQPAPWNHLRDPNPFGHLDEVSSPAPGRLRVRGWAVDPNEKTTSINVHVYAGASYVGAFTANQSRPDVGDVHAGYGALHGFDYTFDVSVYGNQNVCAYGINVGPGSVNTQIGCTATNVVKPSPPPATAPKLTSVMPARLLETCVGASNETADGVDQGIGQRGAGTVTELVIAGRGGVPVGATAVMLNVTAIRGSTGGYITVFPCGTTRPLASNLNFAPGQVVANTVFAKLGTGGKVCIYTHATVGAAVDVTGFVPSGGAPTPLEPARLLETRSGASTVTVDGADQGIGVRAAGSVTELVVAGRGGVPANASAAMLNVTAISGSTGGYITVFPCGTTRPLASNLNFGASQVIANTVFAKLGTGGKVCIYTHAITDVAVDVSGFVPAGSTPNPLLPARLLETRSGASNTTVDGVNQGIGVRAAGSVTELVVAGRGGVPTSASTAIINVTAIRGLSGGYVTVFPCGTTRPLASNLNFAPGQVIANTVLAKLDSSGKVCIYVHAATDLAVDVAGYVAG